MSMNVVECVAKIYIFLNKTKTRPNNSENLKL